MAKAIAKAKLVMQKENERREKEEKEAELKKKMEEDPKSILIDCREQGEWDEKHVDGFTLIPLSCFEQSLKILKDEDKEVEIHIMCRSGKRSLNACLFLEENGFTFFRIKGDKATAEIISCGGHNPELQESGSIISNKRVEI